MELQEANGKCFQKCEERAESFTNLPSFACKIIKRSGLGKRKGDSARRRLLRNKVINNQLSLKEKPSSQLITQALPGEASQTQLRECRVESSGPQKAREQSATHAPSSRRTQNVCPAPRVHDPARPGPLGFSSSKHTATWQVLAAKRSSRGHSTFQIQLPND